MTDPMTRHLRQRNKEAAPYISKKVHIARDVAMIPPTGKVYDGEVPEEMDVTDVADELVATDADMEAAQAEDVEDDVWSWEELNVMTKEELLVVADSYDLDVDGTKAEMLDTIWEFLTEEE